MKKRLVSGIVVLSLTAAVALGGCGTDSASDSSTASNSTVDSSSANSVQADNGSSVENETQDEIIIGYNSYGDTSDFSKRLSEGFIERAEAAGMTVLKADTGGDPTTALQNVDTFIQQGADLIFDSSWVVSACEAVAERCEENNIPCVITDIYVENESAYYMGIDNTEVGLTTGRGAAAWINENWDGQLDYVLIAFNESFGEGVRPRVSAVVDGLAEEGIEISEDRVVWVDPQSSDAAVACRQLGTDFLTAHPDGEHILMVGANDEMAQGFLAAVETAGRTDNCILVSNDLTTMGIASLYEDNIWIGSTAFFPENYGATLVPMIEDILAGQEVEKEVYTEIEFVDRSNIEQYYENPNG